MIFALAAAVALVAVLVAACWVWHRRSVDRLVSGSVRRRCLVQLNDGSIFHGVLFDADPTCLQVRNASTLDDNGQPRDVDGEVLIHRVDVAFLQFP